MDRAATVAAMPTSQLIRFLSQHGISSAGIDSVWEKEVTGSMLCEFCEEDIKDVFAEFKDRFHIRKLLRDLSDKTASSLKSGGQSVRSQSDPFKDQTQGPSSSEHPVYIKQEPVSSNSRHGVPASGCNSQSVAERKTVKYFAGSRKSPDVIDLEKSDSSVESEALSRKRPRLDDVFGRIVSQSHIPAAHSHPYTCLQPGPGLGAGQFSAIDSFLPSFLPKPDFPTALSPAHCGSSHDDLRSKFDASGVEERALCLKKSPPQVSLSPLPRPDTSSPATQPSSTTPDYLHGLEAGRLDAASVATLTQLASRYSAGQILSKKSQRSRPNPAQKLGSILIRSAAQTAELWGAPPHLRSIPPPQRHAFLSAVYQVAPHIRRHESLLWQRLSETLQNRRKYLLDKRLGKRGFSNTNQSSTPPSAVYSTSRDLGDVGEWQVTSVHAHLNSLGAVDSRDDAHTLEEVASAQNGTGTANIKQEPDA